MLLGYAMENCLAGFLYYIITMVSKFFSDITGRLETLKMFFNSINLQNR